MSVKWTGSHSESGILRKSERKEKKEELFVFGYSCKLFRDDEKAIFIDQGKHLIPWMGDESLKIDRYDARGALHDLSALEAPPGGYDWRVELTKAELDVEQLCDEERYRALHTDEDAEEMYREEELKRLHAAGYGQVGFNYDTQVAEKPAVPPPADVDEQPYIPNVSYKAMFLPEIIFPETQKQNAIIEKTATFVAGHGAQMEILMKAKQGDNPQFKFLNRDSNLNPYYMALTSLIKLGRWPEKSPEPVEDKPQHNNEYLHPSLASTIIEIAPSIPSIHYKPSADCDYTLLISKMRGTGEEEDDIQYGLGGDVAPPGTEPLPPRDGNQEPEDNALAADPPAQSYQATHAPHYAAPPTRLAAPAPSPGLPPGPAAPAAPSVGVTSHSTGLSLMKHYASDDSDSDSDTSSLLPPIPTPPEEVRAVIEKMASYVARNGDEFADIVRAKNDPRFIFLEDTDVHHPFYKRLMYETRRLENGADDKKPSVSFSIKKQKEPEPILPKPALPYESSSDNDSENTAKEEQPTEANPTNIPQFVANPNNKMMPTAVVYKLEGSSTSLPIVKTYESAPNSLRQGIVAQMPHVKASNDKLLAEKQAQLSQEAAAALENVREATPAKDTVTDKTSRGSRRDDYDYKREKRKHKDKKHYRSKSSTRESKKSEMRSSERDRWRESSLMKKENDRAKRRSHKYREELETEIISLEDNSDEMIDLTGEGDSKEADSWDVVKQQERKRRAAEFLKKVGVDTNVTTLPTSSLASAMVDTLHKKAEEMEKKRRKEKRKRHDKYDYYENGERSHRKSKHRKYRSSDEQEDSELDGSKKKKRKKEKKRSRSNKRKRRDSSGQDEENQQPIQIDVDIQSTLKGLRTASPTKELGLDLHDVPVKLIKRDSSSSGCEGDDLEERRKKRKKDREYSEGEWSSESDGSASESSKREYVRAVDTEQH